MFLKSKTKKSLETQGFKVIQQRFKFPKLIAWQHFMNPDGQPLRIQTLHKSNPSKFISYTPFVILGVDFLKGRPTKEDEEKAIDLINQGIVTSFIYMTEIGRYEIITEDMKVITENGNTINTRYIG